MNLKRRQSTTTGSAGLAAAALSLSLPGCADPNPRPQALNALGHDVWRRAAPRRRGLSAGPAAPNSAPVGERDNSRKDCHVRQRS